LLGRPTGQMAASGDQTLRWCVIAGPWSRRQRDPTPGSLPRERGQGRAPRADRSPRMPRSVVNDLPRRHSGRRLVPGRPGGGRPVRRPCDPGYSPRSSGKARPVEQGPNDKRRLIITAQTRARWACREAAAGQGPSAAPLRGGQSGRMTQMGIPAAATAVSQPSRH
jgi:hypothetical protein